MQALNEEVQDIQKRMELYDALGEDESKKVLMERIKAMGEEKEKLNKWREDLQKHLQGMQPLSIVKECELQGSPCVVRAWV